MSGNCRTTPKNTHCDEVKIPAAGGAACPSFSVCLPFGARLEFDGTCLRYTPGLPIPDGVYGRLIVENNCLTGVMEEEIPVLVPAPCTPVPAPCTGGPGGGGEGLVLDPDARNLLAWDMASRLSAILYVTEGEGVTVTGAGTQASPLRITSTITPNDTFIVSGTGDILSVSGAGTQADPYQVSHLRNTSFSAGNYGGFTVDRFGHITAYTEPSSSGITSIQGTPGNIDVQTLGSVASINLPAMLTENRMIDVGGVQFTVDTRGRITSIGAGTTPAVDHNFARTFTGARTVMTFSFTSRAGRFRITYRGQIPGTVSAYMVEMPGTMALQVDGEDMSALVHVNGLEAVTANAYEEGSHTVSITLASSVATPGMLDVRVCQ